MEIYKHLVRCEVYNDLFLHRKGIFPFKIIFGYDIIAWNGNNWTIYFWNSHFLFLMMWQPTEVHFKTCDVWEFLLLAERSIILVWKHNLNITIYYQTLCISKIINDCINYVNAFLKYYYCLDYWIRLNWL